MRRRWLVLASFLTAFALVAAACGDDDATTTAPPATTTTGPGTTAATTTTSPDVEAAFDVGVTPAPCSDALNEGNGCIYLGVITDLTGPFALFGGPLTAAQEDFWARVNADGGLDGWDVIITAENTVDAKYDIDGQNTAAGAATLATRVAALAQSLGTPQTQSALQIYDENNMVAAPATWWSGWAFSDQDRGLILESGAPYCFEAMNGMSYLVDSLGTDFTWALVRFAGDYGGDYGNGALIAAAQLGLNDPVADIQQTSFAAGGDAAIASTVTALLPLQPQVIVMVTGPSEVARITGGLAQNGFTDFRVIGASPTWHPALMVQVPDLVPLWQATFNATYPWGVWSSDTAGHAAMRAAAEAKGQDPDPGYVAGWVWQYPIKALLEQAIETNDLTRANLRGIAASLESVDYEGMLPERTYAGDPNDHAVRSTLVVGIDPEAPGGVVEVAGSFVSPTAAGYEFDGPCFVFGG